jgi:hypothetical protein
MKILGQVGAVLRFAVRRLAAQPGLALANLLGLTCAVMRVVSIPLYMDATFHRMLREELRAGAGMQRLPPSPSCSTAGLARTSRCDAAATAAVGSDQAA